MRRLTVLVLLVTFTLPSLAGNPPSAAIASAHPLATEAGFEVLEAGGNAFDAAVAVSAALAVVEPYSSGIGGGGFWLLHLAESGRDVMVDGRETAPLAATRDMYLDEAGEPVEGISINGPLAAGIPGEPAALAHIAERYGRLPLSTSLAPAIRLAREGFPVTPHYRRMAGFRQPVLNEWPASAVFLDDGEVPAEGHVIRQPELAETLEVLAAQGHAGFYQGEIAEKLVSGVREAGGIWSKKDLAQYRAVEREPIRSRYRGYELVSAAPPSSGGVALATMLNILDGYDLADLDEAERTHLIIEAMRRAYRDRAEYLGDPDFVTVPVDRLTHPWYAAGLRAGIHPELATPSTMLPGFIGEPGGDDTTHFSILDRAGNYVSATLSVNYPFGSGFVVPGTGVLLNDEMDDFSKKPGVPNVYGLVGAEANAIEPGKRMLSSMSPTFMRNDERVAVLGTPGGSRIITMVLLGLLEFTEGEGPEAWVSRPRFHHQYLPDRVFYEPDAFDKALAGRLTAMGHNLEEGERTWGNMQGVLWDRAGGRVDAASDPRVEGAARVAP